MTDQLGNKLEIREVVGKKQLKSFIRVPWHVYKDDPNWIPPLLMERKDALSSKHPYFKHASWNAWVAYRDGKPVGRISAQIDELHQQRYGNKTGFFGLIEAVDDHEVFSALFATAENWLHARGMQRIAGPYNLSINQEIGILTEGFDTPPCVMTSHSPRYYGSAIEKCGYTPAQELLAYELDIHTYTAPEIMQELISRSEDRIKVRQLSRKNMEADFEQMRHIFNDAWQANWNFVPFTREEFITIGKELLMVVPHEFIRIAEPHEFIRIAELDGEPAAFLVLLPDINSAIADLNGRLLPFGWAKLLWRLKVRFPRKCRIPLMGVRQKYQNTIFGPAMAYMLIDAVLWPALGRGSEAVEMSWILQQNKATRNMIEKFGGKITKRYHMYEKELVPSDYSSRNDLIEIREVGDKRDLDTFIKIPWRIYSADPHWVPPLIAERRDAFSSKHPYFEHASWKAWIAYRNGEPVGRISAQIDELHQQRYNNRSGYFGLLEAPDDERVFSALFETAESWLKENGMCQVAGPYNLGINQEIGLLVDGFDSQPYVMTPHAAPYYGPAIEKCGYRPCQELLAYQVDIDTYTIPKLMRTLIRRTGDKVEIRHLNRKKMNADFEIMRDIFNDAWQENWNFVPFTKKEFRSVARELLMVVPDEFLQIAEIDGKPAAFIVLLPDINDVISDLDGRLLPFGWLKLWWRLKVRFPQRCRIPLMGVRQEYQNTIYGPAMAYMLIEAVIDAGIAKGGTCVEMSWVLEQNKGTRNIIEQFGGKVTKRYHMYEKSLE
jgi:hypothetical protein